MAQTGDIQRTSPERIYVVVRNASGQTFTTGHGVCLAVGNEDVAVSAASPLHAGLLGSKRDHWMGQGRFTDLYGRLERVEGLLKGHPEGVTRVALRYLLSDPRVKIILSGVSTIEELEVSASVSDGQVLSPELIERIESL